MVAVMVVMVRWGYVNHTVTFDMKGRKALKSFIDDTGTTRAVSALT
jgi:hypothetical protein